MLLLTFTVVVSATSNENVFAAGDGTAENPYQVATAEQLNAVRNNLSAYYIQTQNIDLSQYKNWMPIGSEKNAFEGSFNGNGYTINNLTFLKPIHEEPTIGLFGYAQNCCIKNVNLNNVSILIESPKFHLVGTLLAKGNRNVELKNISVYGNIEYRTVDYIHAGGIVGSLGFDSSIINSSNFSNITINSDNLTIIGGVAGYCRATKFENCSNFGNITVSSKKEIRAGGIAGSNDYAIMTRCINQGNIKSSSLEGHSSVGGITGDYDGYGLKTGKYPILGEISFCENYGRLESESLEFTSFSYERFECSAGGIAAYINDSNVFNCYNQGDIYTIQRFEEHSNAYGVSIISFFDCGTAGIVANFSGSGICENNINSASHISCEIQCYVSDHNHEQDSRNHVAGIACSTGNLKNNYSINTISYVGKGYENANTINGANGEKISLSEMEALKCQLGFYSNKIIIEGEPSINAYITTTLTATYYDENGNVENGGIAFSCSDEKILQLISNGNNATVKGLKGGKATITATHSSGTTASIEITVNNYTVELEEEYSEFLDEEKETIYSYKVKNGNSVALASETEVVLEIVNKDGTEIARIKNYNDYSGTFEIEGLSIGECELVAKINGVEMDRAPINILGNIADTINNETVLRAKVLLNNNRYKYYRDNDSIHHVHIDGIGLGASVFYQNAGNSLNLLFESITEGKSTNDINASQAYKVVLLKLLYGGNKLDEYMDYANKIDTYFLKYGSMIENKTPILGVNNVKDLKTQFSNLLKGSTIDLGILDSVLVVGKSMRECISEMERIYMLASCSDSQVKALQLIAANTSDKNLKQACNELATEIIIATDTKLIQAAGTGFVAGWNTLVEETACSVVQGALNFIPGVTVWNISLDATKLGLNSLFKIDDSAEDLINLSALHSIENSLYNAMLNAEKKFSSNMTADNALNFMATADFYKEILLYGNDVIRNMVVHNAEAKVNLNATKLVLKSLFDSEKDLVDTVNSYFEKEGITHQLECIDQLKTLLENADFYSTDGIDIAAYIREVKSTTPSEWAKPEIQKAIDMCILPDYMQNNYQNNITRAEFCTLLTYFIEAKGENVDSLIKEKGALIKTPFSDTYYEYVDYMYKLGIVNGVGDGIFQPLGEITREQAATMLMRAAKVLDVDTTAKNSGFTGISDWASDGVNYVVYNGIMNGTGNGFEPQGKFTKEQAIATLVRMLGKV